jgi:DNA-binding transcriptional regulator YhcF (GntR family)
MKVIAVDTASAEPPFEQVRRQIAALVADGELAAGQRLPTVRQLAADLGLANNTVARAYRELEAAGVIATHGRRGTFVRSGLLDDGADQTDVQAAAADYVRAARRRGLSLAEATRLIETDWTEA